MTKLIKDLKKEIILTKKDKKRDRQIRKKNWEEGRKYCIKCYYSLKENEGEEHLSCFAASQEKDRVLHPNLFKILKNKKRLSMDKDQ